MSRLREDALPALRQIEDFSLSDLEAVRLLLRGGSVIDWHRLNFESRGAVEEFVQALEVDLSDPVDVARVDSVRASAVGYLRRNFEFPIPRPVEYADLPTLLELASARGHRQLCACTILKVMHIIYHLEAREVLFRIPISDQEVFQLVEQKIYRVIGSMLSRGFPILEFIGGRKNKDSVYTKLLSKQETVAAQIYDKLRFRLVTRSRDAIFPVLNYLMREVFPFNYVIPGESTNTIFHFRSYAESKPALAPLVPRLQLAPELEDELAAVDNRFSARDYRVVHFVVDLPVRLPERLIAGWEPVIREFGKVIFVQTEFQVIDRETEQANELGEASHAAYKERQKLAVIRRLKMGYEGGVPKKRGSLLPPPSHGAARPVAARAGAAARGPAGAKASARGKARGSVRPSPKPKKR